MRFCAYFTQILFIHIYLFIFFLFAALCVCHSTFVAVVVYLTVALISCITAHVFLSHFISIKHTKYKKKQKKETLIWRKKKMQKQNNNNNNKCKAKKLINNNCCTTHTIWLPKCRNVALEYENNASTTFSLLASNLQLRCNFLQSKRKFISFQQLIYSIILEIKTANK